WQIFDQMVTSVSQGKVAEFVAAGGLLSHYVGDACQPLHVSKYHHGRPDHPEEATVHSVYETSMLDRYAIDLIPKVNEALKKPKDLQTIGTGPEAARAVIDLMRTAVGKLPPLAIIDAFNS